MKLIPFPKNSHKRNIVILVVWLLLITNKQLAQDLHFSQSFEQPMFLNPSLTSCGKCNHLAGLTYRNQWSGINMPVKSYTAYYEAKIQPKSMFRDYFAIGGYFFSEAAGDGPLKTNGFILNTALKKYLGWGRDTLHVSLGFGFGYGQRNINFENLTFLSQWNGISVNPSQPPELSNYNNQVGYWDLNGGMNFFYEPYRNTISYDAGISLMHINKPDISFAKSNNKQDLLPVKMNIHARFHSHLSNFISLMAGGLYSIQGYHHESLFGLTFTQCLVQKQTANLSFDSGIKSPVELVYGLWFRMGQVRDISPMVGLNVNGLNMLMSYDIPFFNSKHVTNYKGSFEISLSKSLGCKFKSRCNCKNYGF